MIVPDPLWAHLTAARWFASKGRGATPGRMQALDWYVLREDLGVRSVLVEAVLPGGTTEVYHLLLSHRPDPQPEGFLYRETESADDVPGLDHVHDAVTDPQALRAVVDTLGSGGGAPTWQATMVRPGDLSGDLRVFGGQQSNTSVLVGQEVMIKFFRRLEAGANLDIAVHDALARAGVSSVARLHGWLSARPGPGGPLPGHTDLAMVVQQLSGAQDGWEVATEAARTGADFTAEAAELGRSLAQIHLALADTFETTTRASGELGAGMTARLGAAAQEAPALAGLVADLRARFESLAGQQISVQRIHGDFHLGQTLLTDEGWRIIDFEGEPIKSLAERAAPDSPWRDVAGMLRSLAYATSVCEDADSVETRAWLASSQQAFLDAYAEARLGGRMDPRTQDLVDAYVADKAIYEVVYETRNRPDWVDIPLRALRALAS